jgi:hypothetical protein
MPAAYWHPFNFAFNHSIIIKTLESLADRDVSSLVVEFEFKSFLLYIYIKKNINNRNMQDMRDQDKKCSLWSQVRALWLLIWWPLEAYIVVNFRACGISRGAPKLARTPTLN